MIDRRRFLLTSLAGAFAVPLASTAQQPGKAVRIGMLGGGTPAAGQPHWDEFRKGLSALGYKEGLDVILEYKWAEGRAERLPELAAELAKSQVRVIVAGGSAALAAARIATSVIPIVMVHVGDPVGAGQVASLARPGGNITGLSTTLGPELQAKRLELLKDTLPRLSLVAVLLNPDARPTSFQRRDIPGAATSLGLKHQILEARRSTDYESAFEAAVRQRVGALLVLEDVLSYTHRARIVELAAGHRLPAIYASRDYVTAGGLMSYGPDMAEHYRGAATYIDKILKGARPADLPIEQPTKFELGINLKTAKALGLTIPPSLLLRADQVIE